MLKLASEQDTLALGAALAAEVRRGDVIAVTGPLGAGKTTLARGFIQKLAGDEEVVSPTFTLVQTYDTPKGAVWHFDLYRLNDPDEALELGFEEALAAGISLIEWPERLGGYLPPAHLRVALSMAGDGRTVELTGTGWADRIATVMKHVR
jgi:tRNA threonylcarbamoyladenosine biosynthesis protein TsaE